MAQKVTTTVELTDDVDGGKADQTISFAWDGASYEIDLSKKNAAAFGKALKPYLDHARKAKPSRRRGAAKQSAPREQGRRGDLAEIRAWAKANGHEVSDRGRIPNAVMQAFDAK